MISGTDQKIVSNMLVTKYYWHLPFSVIVLGFIPRRVFFFNTEFGKGNYQQNTDKTSPELLRLILVINLLRENY